MGFALIFANLRKITNYVPLLVIHHSSFNVIYVRDAGRHHILITPGETRGRTILFLLNPEAG
jgi:hypothetical protein